MVKIVKTNSMSGLPSFVSTIRNRLYRDTGRFGLFNFGNYEFGAENAIGRDADGVYQMRPTKNGPVAVKMRFQLTREETPTPARVANWNKFAAGVAAWHLLTDEEKLVYNNKAKGTTKYGFNIFLSEYMLS